MYCIVGLARTATTYTANIIHAAAVLFRNPKTLLDIECTNRAYHSPKVIKQSFKRLTLTTPTPVVKLISNHDFRFTENLLSLRHFKHIFIEPENLRNQVLKVLVSKATKKYFGDRKQSREPFLGKLSFTQEQLDERLRHYQQHMTLKTLCDVFFTDKEIIETPSDVLLEKLGLDNVTNHYKHVPPIYGDYEMLHDVNDFINKYNNSCIRILGEVK
jgi:hypothetical protein